ncbi:NAD(P)-dependent oxidoreductase [Saccharospirillum sp.]|uniref:NAD(P)-dependent oxidoreductase n=1 Tax=Saccharospirillum sp. TaxID=2033801 RepID=UPI0034A00B4A
MKLLVTDAEGPLARALGRLASAREITAVLVPDAELDLTDAVAVAALLKQHRPDYVINAYVHNDLEPEVTVDSRWPHLIDQGVAVLAEACQQAGAALLQVSSEQVFDGNKATAYSEQDAAQPITAVGRDFLLAEQAVRDQCERHLILRSSWVFSADGRNFLTHIVAGAQQYDVIQVLDTQRGCPTAATDLARVIVAMLEQVDCDVEPPLWGTYHYAGSDVTHWHIFAEAIVKATKSCIDVEVESVEAIYPQGQDESLRPQNLELSTRKILATFGIKQLPWRRGVQDALKLSFDPPSETSDTGASS